MNDDSGWTTNIMQNDSKDESFIPDRSYFDSDDSRVSQVTSCRDSVSYEVEHSVLNQSTLSGLQNPDTDTLHLPIERS